MIKIEDLTIRFGEQLLVESLDLQVHQGKKVVITGKSGGGKSSLLKAIAGLIKPAKGRIHIDNQLLEASSVWQLRNRIGYVAQEPDLSTGTVRQAIQRPFSFKSNQHLKENLTEIEEYFKRFFLSASLLDKDIDSVSGGEKQRIALICALLLDREILLLDEVTSALDPDSRQAVIETLKGTNKTMLIVSHDESVNCIADEVISLNNSGLENGELR